MTIFSAVAAANVLTWTDVAVNTNTVIIGGKTYTFLDTLVDADGNIHIGADAEACIDNLVAAVMLDPTLGETGVPGDDYAAAMAANPMCSGSKSAADEFTASCLVPGTIGNLVVIGETLANAAWAAAAVLLVGGTGDAGFADLVTYSQAIRDDSPHGVNSGVIAQLVIMETELLAF